MDGKPVFWETKTCDRAPCVAEEITLQPKVVLHIAKKY